MTDVPKLAASIIDTVSFSDYFNDSFDKFYLEGFDGRRRHSLAARCGFDASASLFATVPTMTRNVYLTISDGDASVVRRVLATLEDIESEGSVEPGNVALFDEPALDAHGYCGVLVALPSIFNALDHVPFTMTVQDAHYRLLAVLFLSRKEHLIWRERGHDALMDHFAAINRDIIRFGARPPSGTA